MPHAMPSGPAAARTLRTAERPRFRRGLVAALASALWGVGGWGEARADLTLGADAKSLALTEGLAVGGVSSWGRRPINTDAVVQMLVDGTFGEPKAGDVVKRPGEPGRQTDRAWAEAKAGEDGAFGELPRGAYVLCTVDAAAERVMILEASGHAVAYVNAEPRVGDPYGHGYVKLPVLLRKGRNQLLFAHAGRGPMTARLVEPTSELMFNMEDVTAPDVVRGAGGRVLIGVPLINATARERAVAVWGEPGPGDAAAAVGGWSDTRLTLPPCSVTKVPVEVGPPKERDGEGEVALAVGPQRQRGPGSPPVDRQTIRLRFVDGADKRKITFVSDIDGSVQYYAVVPPLPATEGEAGKPALVLSLHGASVEATNQARSYAPKPGMVIACPTNRRPFGFDWEDWGRLDALEVLEHAKRDFGTDPDRQYLTGHSMGGHGTWQLGVLRPDLFAAIAPSAGWLSFDTYVNARPDAPKKESDPLLDVFTRAAASSDTLAMLGNLKGKGIYILHGDADDNVPVSEARRGRAELDGLGIPYEFHEETGAGHWWDKEKADKPDPYGGAACVDWPGIFETFGRHSLAGQRGGAGWTTTALSGAVAGGAGLPAVAAPERPGRPATVRVERGPGGRLALTTDNAAVVDVPASLLGGALRAWTIDGKAFTEDAAPDAHRLVRGADGAWTQWTPWLEKRQCRHVRKPDFPGPFKSAFTGRFVLVYGTAGSPEENAWSLAKARFDAEQWWYRGNGHAPVMSDKAFLEAAGGGVDRDRNAVLYGNEASNVAVAELLAATGVRVAPGLVGVGGRTLEGGGLAVLLVHPARVSDGHCRLVGVVGGTDLRGMRATDRVPYFLAGVGIPDVAAFAADTWTRGPSGVRLAGFFGPDWSVERGEMVWRDADPAPASTDGGGPGAGAPAR